MTRTLPAILALTLAYATAATAADAAPELTLTSHEFQTPLVELYTSEGCSSCPRADDWLRQLGASLDARFHAVPLAFHVDYWNYLGWEDPYSKADFTARQREAAAYNRQRNIYTPEFMVNGREQRGGPAVVQAIHSANAQPAQARIEVRITRLDGGHIRARLEVETHAPQGAPRAYVAVYENNIERKISGGENRGRTLKHDFVVRHWSKPIALKRGLNNANSDLHALDISIPEAWRKPHLGFAVVVDDGAGATLQSVSASLASLFAG